MKKQHALLYFEFLLTVKICIPPHGWKWSKDHTTWNFCYWEMGRIPPLPSPSRTPPPHPITLRNSHGSYSLGKLFISKKGFSLHSVWSLIYSMFVLIVFFNTLIWRFYVFCLFLSLCNPCFPSAGILNHMHQISLKNFWFFLWLGYEYCV